MGLQVTQYLSPRNDSGLNYFTIYDGSAVSACGFSTHLPWLQFLLFVTTRNARLVPFPQTCVDHTASIHYYYCAFLYEAICDYFVV